MLQRATTNNAAIVPMPVSLLGDEICVYGLARSDVPILSMMFGSKPVWFAILFNEKSALDVSDSYNKL